MGNWLLFATPLNEWIKLQDFIIFTIMYHIYKDEFL